MKIYKEDKKQISKRLANLQRKIKDSEKSVLILIEGYESSNKGYYINELIHELDPRNFTVNVFERPTEEELRHTFMWKFFINTPKKGEIRIHDRSYYMNILDNYENFNEDDLYRIEKTEKMLIDNNTIIIKFFIDISKKVQEKNIEKLLSNEETKFRVTEFDLNQNKNYKYYKKHMDNILKRTDFDFCKWHILDGDNKEKASYQMLSIVEDTLLSEIGKNSINEPIGKKNVKSILEEIDLNKSIDEATYKIKLKKLQKEAKLLAYELYTKKISTIIVFEGWDAAGKGGSIKRLTKKMDPRGYNVIPIAAPTKEELDHHYLWRFFKHLPKSGHIVIFDRSWYGRVMVEKIEKFASPVEVERAYEEINTFEEIISKPNTIIIKFFIHIDKNTQLERFKERENDPEKNYKITEEDWRNRNKWSQYQDAINEMIDRTSDVAKWHIIEGNQKEFARIKVLETFIEEVKEYLNK